MLTRYYKLALLLIFSGLLIWFAIHYRANIDPQFIKETVKSYGIWAPIIFICIYSIGVVIAIPGWVLTFSGGIIFGPVFGVAYNITGATIGAALAFLIARYFAGDWVKQRTGQKLRVIMNGIEAEGWRFVALLRLSPIIPFNLLNYALGITQVGFKPYVITSFICMLPGCIAYTYLGHLGLQVAGQEQGLIEKALLALFLLALAAYTPRLLRLIRKQP